MSLSFPREQVIHEMWRVDGKQMIRMMSQWPKMSQECLNSMSTLYSEKFDFL